MTPDSLAKQLRKLPERPPPPGSWARLERRLERRTDRLLRAAVATALAACVGAFAVLGFRQVQLVPTVVPSVDRPLAGLSLEEPVVSELQARSRDLEAMLRQVPDGPQLLHADSRQGAGELQVRIAAIDARLRELDSAARRSSLSARLWHERVELLNELVRLRYQEAGLKSF